MFGMELLLMLDGSMLYFCSDCGNDWTCTQGIAYAFTALKDVPVHMEITGSHFLAHLVCAVWRLGCSVRWSTWWEIGLPCCSMLSPFRSSSFRSVCSKMIRNCYQNFINAISFWSNSYSYINELFCMWR